MNSTKHIPAKQFFNQTQNDSEYQHVVIIAKIK